MNFIIDPFLFFFQIYRVISWLKKIKDGGRCESRIVIW